MTMVIPAEAMDAEAAIAVINKYGDVYTGTWQNLCLAMKRRQSELNIE